ncbi:MAG: hypothetical protein ACI86H_002466 [bacterium]
MDGQKAKKRLFLSNFIKTKPIKTRNKMNDQNLKLRKHVIGNMVGNEGLWEDHKNGSGTFTSLEDMPEGEKNLLMHYFADCELFPHETKIMAKLNSLEGDHVELMELSNKLGSEYRKVEYSRNFFSTKFIPIENFHIQKYRK